MKILYVIDCRLDAGGAPLSTSILANEMAQEHEVYILMPQTEESGNPQIHYIQLSSFKDSFPFIFTQPFKALLLIWKIYKAVKKVSPDIIHAEMPRGARALGVLKKMGLINIPLIYTEREFVTGLRKRYQFLYRILVASPYDLIICLSNKAVPFWRKYREDGVVVIPNPGGKQFDSYSEKDRETAINQLEGYKADSLNVMFAGRYLKAKRWDLIEEIINYYNQICPKGKVHFHIAVIYNITNDKEATNMIERLQNKANITIYPNADTNRMSDLYYACDLHFITSSVESFGRTAIEAMSRKCIVYSTDAGAISETIGDRQCILPPKADAFVRIISEYENDKVKIEKQSQKMYYRYQQLYTTKANYEANMKEYIKLIGKDL